MDLRCRNVIQDQQQTPGQTLGICDNEISSQLTGSIRATSARTGFQESPLSSKSCLHRPKLYISNLIDRAFDADRINDDTKVQDSDISNSVCDDKNENRIQSPETYPSRAEQVNRSESSEAKKSRTWTPQIECVKAGENAVVKTGSYPSSAGEKSKPIAEESITFLIPRFSVRVHRLNVLPRFNKLSSNTENRTS